MRRTLDYASRDIDPRLPPFIAMFINFIRQFAVVRDPAVAILTGLHLEFLVFLTRGEFPSAAFREVMGTERNNLFAWCWQTVQWVNQFVYYPIAAPIILAAVCLRRPIRTWIYSVYLVTTLIVLGIQQVAAAYLATQLTGVWATCGPRSADWTMLLQFFPTCVFLLIRLFTPRLKFAGPRS